MVEHKVEIKMIKIYKADTFEKYKYLLGALRKRGAKWMSGDPLDNELMAKKGWDICGRNGIAVYRDSNNKVVVSSLKYVKKEIEVYEREGQECTIIEDVKLPKPSEKPKESEAQQVQPHQSDVIQPGHYNQGDMDLFEIFYHQYPFNEFRTGMRMIAARYYHRYPDKNGLQDYDKGDEVMRRLREYEEREANE